MDFIKQINEEVREQQSTSAVVLEGVKHLSEKSDFLKGLSQQFIIETASSELAKIALQLSKKSLTNPDEAVDVVTLLTALADPDLREALHDHVNSQQFNILVSRLGDHEKVMNFVRRNSKIQSLTSMKNNVKQMLTSLDNPEEAQKAVQTVNKLRMTYERIQQQLAQQTNKQAGEGSQTNP